MENETYTTEIMDLSNIRMFEEWFDKIVGTEIEIEDFGINEWSATCFDLTRSEVQKCRNWENRNG